MAIADMSRVRLYGLENEREAVLSELMHSGAIQIEDAFDADPDETETVKASVPAFPETVSLRRVGNMQDVLATETVTQDILASLNILSKYAPQKKGMFSVRKTLSKHQVQEVLDRRNDIITATAVYRGIEDKLNELKAEENRLSSRIEYLTPWLGIGVDLSIEQTMVTRIQAGTLPATIATEAIKNKLADAAPEAELRIHFSSKELHYCLAVWHTTVEAEALNVLKAAGWNRINFKDLPGLPDLQVAEIQTRLSAIGKEKAILVQKVMDLSENCGDIEILYDALLMERERKKAAELLVATGKVFLLRGFVATDMVEALTKKLEKDYLCHVEAEAVTEVNHTVPVLVRNNGLTEAIRPVMEMYGTPSPREIDPNFLTLPFFAIFFGLIMSDAGYGLLLAGASGFVLLKMKLEDNVRRFAKLFFFCGLATIFWGIMFGGFFGIAFFSEHPLWFSPTAEGGTEELMKWCLLFGIIHLYTGMGLKAANLIRRKQFLDAIFDVGFPIMMFTGFAMTVMPNVPGLDPAMTKPISAIGIYVLIVGVALVVITAGRKSKSVIGKVFGGLPRLYDIIGFLGDVLSYMRLLALALAGSILSGLINGMAGDLGGLVAKIIGGTLLILVGHGINIAMSVLGAFVHSCRLQYLEFFSKFLEGGGQPFRPFGPVTRYIVMKQEE